MSKTLAHMGRYMLFIARRERVRLPVWLLSLIVLNFGVAFAFIELFPDPQSLMEMAIGMSAPAMQALMGPVYGLEALTQAILFSQEMLITLIIAVAVMNIFFVIRHTRTDEELGRLEMLRALPVGRLTNAASTLLSAFILNTVLALALAGTLLLVPLPGITADGALNQGGVAGCFAYGLAIGACGFLFAAVALLGAQFFTGARGTTIFSFALFALFYVLRAVGDIAADWLNQLSPIGLALQTRCFYDNNFLPLVFIFAAALCLGLLALLICSSRDVGQGLFSSGTGRQNASPLLRSPFGLAWRLTRGSFLAWIIGLFAMGIAYGAFTESIGDLMDNSDVFKSLLEGPAGTESAFTEKAMAENYVAMILFIMSLMATIPAIITALTFRGEENRGRLEPLLARSVRRWSVLGGYALIAAVESAVLLFCGAFGMYLASASSGFVTFAGVIQAGMVYLPAVWSILGLSLFFVGLLPKLKGLVWVMPGYSLIVLYFGKLLKLPEWCSSLTPYGHIPMLPMESIEPLPLILLTIIGAVLTALGLYFCGRRDIGKG